MFRRTKVERGRLEALERIEAWARDRFALVGDAIVLVSESPCLQPGYPPSETTVRFWIDGERYRLTVFKPADAIVASDLPVAWLLPALLDDGEAGCC